MIRLQLVDETTFEQVMDLSVSKQDERRVAPNAYSLAQAWLLRDSRSLFPYTILASEKVVGFLLLDKDSEKGEYFLWRLMIDQAEQNKGYGKEAVRKVMELALADDECRWLTVDYVFGNHRMRGMLESLGFQTVGLSGHEMVMKLKVEKKEKQ